MKDIPNCKSCRKELKKQTDKTMCTFCGYACCPECTIKTRPYPLSALDSNKKRSLRGTICKMCDRKFFVKSLVDTKMKQIETNKVSISSF